MSIILNPIIRQKIDENSPIIEFDVSVNDKTKRGAIRLFQSDDFDTYGYIRLLKDNLQIPLLMNNITSVFCFAKLPNGLSSTIDCDINDDNAIVLKLSDSSIIAHIGNVLCEIVVTGTSSSEDYYYTTFPFHIIVGE